MKCHLYHGTFEPSNRKVSFSVPTLTVSVKETTGLDERTPNKGGSLFFFFFLVTDLSQGCNFSVCLNR